MAFRTDAYRHLEVVEAPTSRLSTKVSKNAEDKELYRDRLRPGAIAGAVRPRFEDITLFYLRDMLKK